MHLILKRHSEFSFSINSKLTIKNPRLNKVFWHSTCSLIIEFLYLTVIKSRNIFFLFVFSLTVCFSVRGNNIEKGFEALQEYNYFEAKRIFLKTIKKDSSAAGFGLATIFFRNDNPFHSLDSAHKFISISERNFKNISTKSKEILARFNIDYLSVLDLRAKISLEYFKIALKINTEDGYQEFILKNQWANERFLAIHKRDSIVFDLAKKKNTASDINAFMMKYPESEYILDAQKVFDLCQYKEYTYDGKIDSYVSFCKEYPRSRYVKDAEDKIYELYTVNKSILEYVDFVKNYPNNRNIENAWRKIYQLYMIDYSEDIIQKFKEDFPNYPFKSELELDIEYAKRQMLPFKDSLLFGCIDFDGNVLMKDWLLQLEMENMVISIKEIM